MSELLNKFMVEILGEEGSSALQKAADRHAALSTVLPARSVLGWLLLAGRYGFEGQIPGIENSYLSLNKKEGGLFSGFIETASTGVPESYEFDNANILHVAAATSVALGADITPDPSLRQVDVARLGKNLDILIMSRFIKLVKQELEESSSEESSVEKGEFESGVKAKPLTPKAPEEPIPPSPRQENKNATKKPGFSITKSQANAKCEVCGEKQIKKHQATLCYCMRDLAKHTKAIQTETGYTLEFDDQWTENDISVFKDIVLGE